MGVQSFDMKEITKLTTQERDTVAVLFAQKATGSEIARQLVRSKSTISDEIQRNRRWDAEKRTWVYEAIYAQEETNRRMIERRKQPLLKKGRGVHHSRIPERVSIHLRLKVIDKRTVCGHFEGDTIEGRRHIKDGIHTEVERLSRVLFAIKVRAITSEEGLRAQREIFTQLPQ